MVEKCANPACSERFDHRQGRFYCCPLQSLNGDPPANCHGVEHHWLCESCSELYTFERHAGMGVIVTLRVAASPKGQRGSAVRIDS